MTDSEKAAQEIADKIVGLGSDTNAWGMSDGRGYYFDSGDSADRKVLIEKIRQIIDKHMC